MSDGLRLPPEVIETMRQQLIDEWMKPLAETLRIRHVDKLAMRSAVVCVAQYWDDEAYDAVHSLWLVSQLEDPDWEAGLTYRYRPYPGPGEDPVVDNPDPNLPSGYFQSDLAPTFQETQPWKDNTDAIPIAAAWCREGANQDLEDIENYLPFVILRYVGGTWRAELQPMVRPWLNGVPSMYQIEPLPVEQVWNRSLTTLPEHPRSGDIALAQILALIRTVHADPEWFWIEDVQKRLRLGLPGDRLSLGAAARAFGFDRLAEAIVESDNGSAEARDRIPELCPTLEELKSALARIYMAPSTELYFSSEQPGGSTSR